MKLRRSLYSISPLAPTLRISKVRERLNRAVSKTVEPLRAPCVRIPPSPALRTELRTPDAADFTPEAAAWRAVGRLSGLDTAEEGFNNLPATRLNICLQHGFREAEDDIIPSSDQVLLYREEVKVLYAKNGDNQPGPPRFNNRSEVDLNHVWTARAKNLRSAISKSGPETGRPVPSDRHFLYRAALGNWRECDGPRIQARCRRLPGR